MPRSRSNKARPIIPIALILFAAACGWYLYAKSGSGDDPNAIANAATKQAEDPTLADANNSAADEVPEIVFVEASTPEPVKDEVLIPSDGRSTEPPATTPDANDDLEQTEGHDADANDDHPAPGTTTTSDPPADMNNDEPFEPPLVKGTGPGERKFSNNPRIDASLQRFESGQALEARQELNRMLAISRDPAEQRELRHHLEKIARTAIFSRDTLPGDPLMTEYIVQSGDYLTYIGREFKVPHEAIMMINNIRDARRLRLGQKLRIPRGPFDAKIYRSEFRMDVYLQDMYVRSFPVGLGAEKGTPIGTWRVKERLPNPTYYPPASATNKKIIPPNDPTNPLGEFWIGLEGIQGQAVGHEGYGIHGTIDPDSIGKAESLGCIRMHNQDVELLYKLLMPDHSTVKILP